MARGAVPALKGMDVAEEVILQGLVRGEIRRKGVGVGEDQREGGQAATGTAEGDISKVGPFGLSLNPGKREEGGGLRGVEGANRLRRGGVG